MSFFNRESMFAFLITIINQLAIIIGRGYEILWPTEILTWPVIFKHFGPIDQHILRSPSNYFSNSNNDVLKNIDQLKKVWCLKQIDRPTMYHSPEKILDEHSKHGLIPVNFEGLRLDLPVYFKNFHNS